MFIEILLIAIIISLVSGGKLSNLGRLDFKYIYIIFSAYLIQVGVDFWASRHAFWGYSCLHIFSYLLLFFALVKNRRLPGIYFILAGTVLNFIVIAVNGGAMPVRSDVISQRVAAVLASGHGGTHTLLTERTLLGFLADIIYIPLPYQKQIISLGDIVINIGILRMIFAGMSGRSHNNS